MRQQILKTQPTKQIHVEAFISVCCVLSVVVVVVVVVIIIFFTQCFFFGKYIGKRNTFATMGWPEGGHN